MDKALLARVEKQAWFHRYPRGFPLLLFVLASIGTIVSVIAIERADAQRREIELDRNATEIASALQRRAAENIAMLHAGAALFEATNTVSGELFNRFARDLERSDALYGAMGIGWAPRITPEALPSLEALLRERGRPDFLVYPRARSEQAYLTPIVHLVPQTGANRRALGYDMYSELTRRKAMDEAARIGEPVATGKVHLVQDREQPGVPGFLVYAPVFDPNGGPEGVRGFVYSPFRAEEFLASASELYGRRNVEMRLYDEVVAPENLLATRSIEGENGSTIEQTINIGNHDWVLQVSSKRPQALSSLSRLTLFFGAVAALLVLAIGRLITRRAVEDRQVLEWLTSQSSIRNSLTRELNHRVKNTLANVLSIAALTRRRSSDLDEFTESLTARIRALSATHDLLSQTNWNNAPLAEVIRSELAPYITDGEAHVEMSGPDILLAPNDAMSLGLAIHELATNAAKYGAFSTPEGKIEITWKLISPECAEVQWLEKGGPPVAPPTKRGFGRDLIEKVVAHELRTEVVLEFAPGGVECRLQVPVRQTSEFTLRRQRLARAAAASV